MKTFCFILAMLCAATAGAFTFDESFRITGNLMERWALAPQNFDVIKTNESSNVVPIIFPTAESLFTCPMSDRIIGRELSVFDKKLAFEQFLMTMSNTNKMSVSRRHIATENYGLIFCADKGYTNGLVAATNALMHAEAPCREVALIVVERLARPSLAMNDVVYSVLTNTTEYYESHRDGLLYAYADRIANGADLDGSVVSNGIAMILRAAHAVHPSIPVDKMLLRRIDSYSVSSNRLTYAREVLDQSDVTDLERGYFSAVTNELLSSGRPLVEVSLP